MEGHPRSARPSADHSPPPPVYPNNECRRRYLPPRSAAAARRCGRPRSRRRNRDFRQRAARSPARARSREHRRGAWVRAAPCEPPASAAGAGLSLRPLARSLSPSPVARLQRIIFQGGILADEDRPLADHGETGWRQGRLCGETRQRLLSCRVASLTSRARRHPGRSRAPPCDASRAAQRRARRCAARCSASPCDSRSRQMSRRR